MHLLIHKSTYQFENGGSGLSFYGFGVGRVGQSVPPFMGSCRCY